MDLAVRASLQGWKFVFVGDVSVILSHPIPAAPLVMWSSQPFQENDKGNHALQSKATPDSCLILQRVSVWKKIHLIYAFFFVRKIVAHWVTFFFYCVVIPACVLLPEVYLPKPLAIYIPAIITILNTGGTPRSLHLLVFWILFENVMSLHRTKASIIGLLEASRVNEWVVTEKLGNRRNNQARVSIFKSKFQCGERIHKLEFIMGIFMLHCAVYNMLHGNDHMFVYLFLQSGAFFTVAFGFIGTFVPTRQ